VSFVAQGQEPEMLIEDLGAFLFRPALSPDGQRVALERYSGWQSLQVWVLQREEEAWARVAVVDGWGPAWTPDGTGLVYGTTRNQKQVLVRRSVVGGAEEVLHTDQLRLEPIAFLPDGQSLLFWRATGRGDILLLGPEGQVETVVATEAAEEIAALSPDGRWFAYESDASGQAEIYLQPFPPEGHSPRLVSTDGGRAPRWAREGLRLFYREGYPAAGRIVAVEVREAPGLSLSAPVTVVETLATGSGAQQAYAFFDVAPDGRVLLAERLTQLEPSELVVVRNWVRELDELFSDPSHSR
jgi:Tol biopolymer transport system component